MSTSSHWAESTVELRRRLSRAVPTDLLRALHEPRPWRHFLVLAWQVLLLVVGVTGALSFDRWYSWLPFSVVIGWTIFNFTVMLHEVVHDAVFRRRRSKGLVVLGWLYAFPSGISRSQFTRWHLDHHAGLGSVEADPKRHHLSPRRNARWFKLLYMTPALIPIYFRAAAREAATYPEDLRRRIAFERLVTVVGQLAILGAILAFAGPWIAFKVYLVPYLLVFPVAFTLNRLGQHYDIDPRDPAKWGTRMARSRLWDIAFLWSSYHLEHHYFPRVPFYNLRRLNVALEPFYEDIGHPAVTYRQLLWQWFVRNRRPHTDWRGDASADGS
ncbi:MAG: fatty acid desaturase [Acidobacteriota bacterium]|nr:fatty acid desaturase [Acidobacteriota bacterium]MDQ7088334.1 fatty acid desaturase [Acidobacteriota bacterium]